MFTRDSEPCIGDVMRKFAPFLKLYSEYVKNFDNAMNTMTVWMDKSPRLMSIVQEIQVQSLSSSFPFSLVFLNDETV